MKIPQKLRTLGFAMLACLFLAGATLSACGTKTAETEETETKEGAAEHPEETEHPADSAEHPAEHPEGEHPADSTASE